MMTVFTQDGKRRTFSSGQSIRDGRASDCAADTVEVQANGVELNMILRQCDGIPRTVHLSQRWFGDIAKFIVANVKL